jgi:ParB-like chromosome segregation protein Spo0J
MEYVALSHLVPNPRNPKAHDLTTIDSSVGRFGFIEPIVRDERTGQIISGHGRASTLASMEARGENPPEGVRVDSEGAWQVPVIVGWASRSDTEASAALIALNRTTELGGWVDDALLSLLDDLAQVDHGFEGVGFTEADRAALAALAARLEAPADLDDLAEQFGEPTDADHLIRVIIDVPPEIASRMKAALAAAPAAEVCLGWLGD